MIIRHFFHFHKCYQVHTRTPLNAPEARHSARVSCVVRWSRTGERRLSIGLEFESVTDDDREMIERYIGRRMRRRSRSRPRPTGPRAQSFANHEPAR